MGCRKISRFPSNLEILVDIITKRVTSLEFPNPKCVNTTCCIYYLIHEFTFNNWMVCKGIDTNYWVQLGLVRCVCVVLCDGPFAVCFIAV